MKLNTKILKGLSEAKVGPVATINDVIKATENNKSHQIAISNIESEIEKAEKVYKYILFLKTAKERKPKIEELYKIFYNIFYSAMKGQVFIKLAKNGSMINVSNKDIIFGRPANYSKAAYDPEKPFVRAFMGRVAPGILDYWIDFFRHPFHDPKQFNLVDRVQEIIDMKATIKWVEFKFEDISNIELIKRDGMEYLYIDVEKFKN